MFQWRAQECGYRHKIKIKFVNLIVNTVITQKVTFSVNASNGETMCVR